MMYPNESNEELIKFFGNPGENLKLINLPFPMRLAWDLNTSVTRMTCNIKVAEDVINIFDEIGKHYGANYIESLGIDILGGCYNKRLKRGSKSQWSVHAFGAALDLNPNKNKLSWKSDKAVFAKPEYDTMIDIFYKYGWYSLGKEKNFDWMHFQAAKPR